MHSQKHEGTFINVFKSYSGSFSGSGLTFLSKEGNFVTLEIGSNTQIKKVYGLDLIQTYMKTKGEVLNIGLLDGILVV